MRALVYKDLVMMYKYNRFLILFALLFAVVAGMNENSMFFAVYPPVVMMALGYSSLAYDERCGWLRYADTLPCGRKKIVTSKYLISLISCGASLIVLMASMTVFGLKRGDLNPMGLGAVALIVLLVGTVYVSLLLPVSFFLGTEKGRFVYILFTVACCCGAYGISWPESLPQINMWLFITLFIVGICLILGTSYLISVKLYQKKKTV